MKKILSAVMSAAIAVSAALPFAGNVSAADDIKNIVVLGDSIASGYGLSESEHNYGELVGHYYGAKTENFAKSGDETSDLIAKLEAPTDELTASLKDADYVLVSIGGNDMLHYAANYLLTVCANAGALNSGYTKDDIPEKPTLQDVNRLVDREALKAYAETHPTVATTFQKLNLHLSQQDNPKYDCYIQKKVIPNIKKIDADIKAINPDVKVVYQDYYDPLQFEKSYYEATYTGNALRVMNLLVPVGEAVTQSFRDQLSGADISGALIADIYDDFTSLEEGSGDTVKKHSWYFTKMQSDRSEMDFHPTQAGHVAIAAKVIDTIGTKENGGNLIVQTFDKLPNKDSYPAFALATYNKVAATTARAADGIQFGDPNNDGNIDAKDASLILTAYAKSSTGADSGLSAEQKTAANINGDALIDAKDASMILNFYSFVSTGGKKTISEYFNL